MRDERRPGLSWGSEEAGAGQSVADAGLPLPVLKAVDLDPSARARRNAGVPEKPKQVT